MKCQVGAEYNGIIAVKPLFQIQVDTLIGGSLDGGLHLVRGVG